jgi:predicted nuclease with TOPRIM domain
MSMSLFEISDRYSGLLSNLMNFDEVSQEQLDEINKLEDSLENKTVSIAAFIKNLEAEKNAVDEAQKAMKERSTRLNKKIESLKDYLKANLINCGMKEITTSPYFKIAIKSNPPKVVMDTQHITLIPQEFLRIKTIEEPDKAKIKEHLQNGNTCAFAHLEMDVRLEIK